MSSVEITSAVWDDRGPNSSEYETPTTPKQALEIELEYSLGSMSPTISVDTTPTTSVIVPYPNSVEMVLCVDISANTSFAIYDLISQVSAFRDELIDEGNVGASKAKLKIGVLAFSNHRQDPGCFYGFIDIASGDATQKASLNLPTGMDERPYDNPEDNITYVPPTSNVLFDVTTQTAFDTLLDVLLQLANASTDNEDTSVADEAVESVGFWAPFIFSADSYYSRTRYVLLSTNLPPEEAWDPMSEDGDGDPLEPFADTPDINDYTPFDEDTLGDLTDIGDLLGEAYIKVFANSEEDYSELTDAVSDYMDDPDDRNTIEYVDTYDRYYEDDLLYAMEDILTDCSTMYFNVSVPVFHNATYEVTLTETGGASDSVSGIDVGNRSAPSQNFNNLKVARGVHISPFAKELMPYHPDNAWITNTNGTVVIETIDQLGKTVIQ